MEIDIIIYSGRWRKTNERERERERERRRINLFPS
jgi:hypothetical protein